MRINKKYLVQLFSIAIITSLLTACNLSVTTPTSLASETPELPLSTATPALSSTPAQTFTPSFTFTPSPTPTLFLAATATPTQQWSACPGIVVTLTDTDAGDMLHILRCEDGLEYDLGPLAKGAYAVGPNDKFLIYATVSGFVYASRIGEPFMYPLLNLVTEQIFTVFNKGVAPDFKISFTGGTPIYRLVLLEKTYDQKRMYNLPPRLTH